MGKMEEIWERVGVVLCPCPQIVLASGTVAQKACAGSSWKSIQIPMRSAYAPVTRVEIGFQGGVGEPKRQGNQKLYSAWRHFATCSISEPVFPEITVLASSATSLPAVLLRVMQKPSQPSGIAEYYLATCSIKFELSVYCYQ